MAMAMTGKGWTVTNLAEMMIKAMLEIWRRK